MARRNGGGRGEGISGGLGWVVFLVVVLGVAAYAVWQYRVREAERRGAGEGPGGVPGGVPATRSVPVEPPTRGPETVPPRQEPELPRVEGPGAGGSGAWGKVSPHLFLGNPSGAVGRAVGGAVVDARVRDNYLMVKPTFALSYNGGKGTPNWVSWRVTAADIEGSAKRKQGFDPDADLPLGFYRVLHSDYTGSGFDRGHLCPHSDRDATTETAWSTFVMTNIIPQAPDLNQKAWAALENYARELVRGGENGRGVTLYVVAGPLGQGGTGSNGRRETLAGGKVVVPAECWKVIVVVPDAEGGEAGGAERVGAGVRVIAVVMPNEQGKVGQAWAGYRVTVAEVERKTGYRFMTDLRAEVAEALRQKLDRTAIPVPERVDYGAQRRRN